MGQGNPYLQAAVMETIDNQIRDNDPPETRRTLDRLRAEGFSRKDARIHIAQAVILEIWDTLKNRKEFNRERYLRNLKNLPR